MITSEINFSRIIYKINKTCDITKLLTDTFFFGYDFDKYTFFIKYLYFHEIYKINTIIIIPYF
jgi:hypothetical protein